MQVKEKKKSKEAPTVDICSDRRSSFLLSETRLKIRPKMRYRKLKVLKIAKLRKMTISSFDESVSPSVTTISARDASASEKTMKRETKKTANNKFNK